MKKLLFTLCYLLYAIASLAQANTHIKFMGIPVTGTIAQFQGKLIAKGCTYDKKFSASLPNGSRAFTGIFVGNKAHIYVYYDIKTKIVYRTKAVISGVSEDIADQEYSKIKVLLSQKYGSDSEHMYTGTKDDKEATSFISTNDDEEIDGEIDLYITMDEQTWVRYPYNYNLHIDYNDRINTSKHNSQQFDDI
ncbi:MAG: hypothetical protein MR900_11275 [Prevotella sp.]|nr:hypothetical protein [Prevotella sp.]MDY5685299.1 hypothetical protein [Prevotella sp.]